jgi:hypothetical protein
MSVTSKKTGRTRHKPVIIKQGWFRKPKIVLVLQEEWQDEGYMVTDGYGGSLDVDSTYWRDSTSFEGIR